MSALRVFRAGADRNAGGISKPALRACSGKFARTDWCEYDRFDSHCCDPVGQLTPDPCRPLAQTLSAHSGRTRGAALSASVTNRVFRPAHPASAPEFPDPLSGNNFEALKSAEKGRKRDDVKIILPQAAKTGRASWRIAKKSVFLLVIYAVKSQAGCGRGKERKVFSDLSVCIPVEQTGQRAGEPTQVLSAHGAAGEETGRIHENAN